MSGRIPDWTLTHTVVIEPYLGHSGTGPVYGPGETWPCLRIDKRKVSRADTNRQVTTDLQLYLAPEAAGRYQPQARVTVDDERVGYVHEVAEHLHPELDTPDHVHLLCGGASR